VFWASEPTVEVSQNNLANKRCKAKPDCSHPAVPLSPRRMLTIVNWSGNWFARVQRSTFTSGRIPSHAIPILWIGNQKFVYHRRCRPTRVVNTTRRRSTSFITPMTVERVVAECIKFITYWSLWRKICGFNRQKLVAIATSLERSLPIFTAVIYARKATNPQSWGKIGRENFEEIWLENSKNQKHFRQLGSFKVIKNGAIRQITYDFYSPFSKCLCRFGDLACGL